VIWLELISETVFRGVIRVMFELTSGQTGFQYHIEWNDGR
jgi:hypothetical protein